MAKTLFDNKKHYDPGRLRHKIQFVQDTMIDDGYGGSIPGEAVILETFAGKEEPSQYTQNVLNAGQSTYNQFQYFIIRNRKGFIPVRDMRVVYGDSRYVVQGVSMLDDPCTFLKVLCVVAL